ncbi:MAG TPA: hypothetical protein VGK32_08010 [Vicinamibacterales bacterium]
MKPLLINQKGQVMAIVTRETSEDATPSTSDRMADAAAHAAHLSHEARMVKSVAEDAIEEGVYQARRVARSVRRGVVGRLEDIKDEGIRYVKRQPLPTIAFTAGVGVMVGLAVGWVAGRGRPKRVDTRPS